MRVCRTFCTSAGYDVEKIKRLIASNCDAIMLDIEDGVVPKRKLEARQTIAMVLKEFDFRGKLRIVRVNSLETGMTWDDLATVLPGIPDIVKVPKMETKEEVHQLDRFISDFEKDNGIENGTIKIGILIETPLGVANVLELVTASPRVVTVGLGMEDITGAYGIQRKYDLDNISLLYIKQKMILASKVAGIGCTAECVLFSSDPEYMRKDTQRCKEWGYTGRSVFSKTEEDLRNIDVVNEIFTPSAEEISWANHVINAFAEACEKGESNVFVDGKFIDPPVITKAEKILEMHKAIEEMKRK